MNSTVSMNQTSPLSYTCIESSLGNIPGLSAIVLDVTVLLPIHIWVLWLGTRDVRRGGSLAVSQIFTMNLCALELVAILLYLNTTVAFAFTHQDTTRVIIYFSGTYLVGRPFMNCLICVERYMAVAYPVIYRNPAFRLHRYICAGVVWLMTVVYGVLAVASYPEPPIFIYICALMTSLSGITACSLGVLKVLLRPSPGETGKERMHHRKKRAFINITAILVCLFISYGLYLIILIIKTFITFDTFCLIGRISMWLMRPSSVIQPLFYLSKLGKLPWTKKVSQ